MESVIEILIVEDSPTQAMQLRHILETEGHRVLAARNGVEALHVLDETRPTLVITDINMPEMDGYELCRQIKSSNKLKDLPVILLTSLSDPEDILRGLECGADNFITKPYEREYLLSRMSHILLNRQLRLSSHAEVGIEIIFAGRKRFLTAERIQILDLLLASFETAVTKTRQLAEKNEELRGALETIDALKTNYLMLLENNPDGMVVVDRNGVIRYCNQAARTLLGAGADLEGQRFPFGIEPGQTNQVTITRDEGELVVVEQRSVPISWEGEPTFLVSLRDITTLIRMQEEIRALSLMDDLTGLHNRRAFFALATQAMRAASRGQQSLSLLFVDLDNMKEINDRLGHQAGDVALVEAARILKESFREADIIARLGGDEFVVLGMGAAGIEAELLAARLERRLEERNSAASQQYRLAMSIGIASRGPEDDCSLEELVRLADQRMYEAKQAKKLRVV